MSLTLEEFIARFGGKDAYPHVEVGADAADWPSFLVSYGEHTAVVQFMGVGQGENAHLCIDVHPFVEGQSARASVFGAEGGFRFEAFNEADTKGTSHGFPATRQVSIMIGKQADRAS